MSPDDRWLLEMIQPNLWSIADLAEPSIPLGGFRLHPKTNSASRLPQRSLQLKEIATGRIQPIPLPEGSRPGFIRWSPDSQHLAFCLMQETGLELWVMNVTEGGPRRLTEPILNAAYGGPFRWFSDRDLICKVIPADRGNAPSRPKVPVGPVIQENAGGQRRPNRTYTNLLEDAHDEQLFEYYLTASLEMIDLEGQRTALGITGLIDSVVPSPDRQYFLLWQIHRPFSYQLPSSHFPNLVQVFDRSGNLIHTVTDKPLADYLSTKFDATVMGPRGMSWRSDRPATLYWVEALDDGNPDVEVTYRDALYELAAPFTDAPRLLWQTEYRFRRIVWGREDVALGWEGWYDNRQSRLWRLDPRQTNQATLLLERSSDDKYSDPGSPVTCKGSQSWYVLRFTPDGSGVYFTGRGASPQGVHPFLDRMTLETGETERLWQCQNPYFETVVEVLDDTAQTFLTRRQSQTDPPNYWLYRDRSQPAIALTQYPDPAPQFAGIHKELVQYERADGVQLSANLYLPSGYDPDRDGPLPTLFWVYPHEFKSSKHASQVTIAENTFSRPYRASVLFLLTQGYAVLDDPKIPIIGEGDEEPNDTYVEQLIAGAKAAVEYVVQRGVTDRDRIGIGGHSYGAFTTVNLLAHTDLFRLGIARSGAYNRSLTPFGFQGEQRTYWEAAHTYHEMAPFTHADKVTAPLLLIHGAGDSNPGTYPVQTERLYEALKGLGATVRWVSLPLEEHGYGSREAVGHVLWEMVQWCDRYLKQSA